MTRRISAVCLVATTLLAVSTPAQAAPKAGTGGDKDQFATGYAYQNVNCQGGATCTVASSADKSGALSGSSDYGRPSADVDDKEAGVGYVTHSTSLAVPAAAKSVTVTAVWQLDIRAAAAASAGTTYGAVYLGVQLPQCDDAEEAPSCETTSASSATPRGVHDTPSLGTSSAGTDGPQTVTLSVELKGSALPKRLSVVPYVGASAGGYPDCPLNGFGCLIKERHAGTSSASFTGTLQSVSLQVSG